jgi:ElaA protein
MNLVWYAPQEIPANALYAILKLRSEVFQLEQNCLFLDLDGLDLRSHIGALWEGDSCIATVRITPPGTRFPQWSFGRLATTKSRRANGFGGRLVRATLQEVDRLTSPNTPVLISAQAYLERFYSSHGFKTTSAPYDEDGIPHIQMLR